jgi:hypothetical protein
MEGTSSRILETVASPSTLVVPLPFHEFLEGKETNRAAVFLS